MAATKRKRKNGRKTKQHRQTRDANPYLRVDLKGTEGKTWGRKSRMTKKKKVFAQ